MAAAATRWKGWPFPAWRVWGIREVDGRFRLVGPEFVGFTWPTSDWVDCCSRCNHGNSGDPFPPTVGCVGLFAFIGGGPNGEEAARRYLAWREAGGLDRCGPLLYGRVDLAGVTRAVRPEHQDRIVRAARAWIVSLVVPERMRRQLEDRAMVDLEAYGVPITITA